MRASLTASCSTAQPAARQLTTVRPATALRPLCTPHTAAALGARAPTAYPTGSILRLPSALRSLTRPLPVLSQRSVSASAAVAEAAAPEETFQYQAEVTLLHLPIL